MQVGAMMFQTDYAITPTEFAIALEERGFESVWLPEHTHIPLSRKSEYPAGGELPQMYYDTLDPFVALAAMAAVTKKLLLGTGICLIPQRDPIHLAKESASVDYISGGRMVLGIGAGWNQDELENHGSDFDSRFKLMDDRMAAVQAMWTQEESEYHGPFVDLDPLVSHPKPVQKTIPVHVGGGWPYAAQRAVKYGQGWMPIGWFTDPGEVLPRFRQMEAEAGKDPGTIEVSMFGSQGEDYYKQCADLGIDRIVLDVPSEPADKVLPILDSYAKMAGL
mgnify:CR=1 FL=1